MSTNRPLQTRPIRHRVTTVERFKNVNTCKGDSHPPQGKNHKFTYPAVCTYDSRNIIIKKYHIVFKSEYRRSYDLSIFTVRTKTILRCVTQSFLLRSYNPTTRKASKYEKQSDLESYILIYI